LLSIRNIQPLDISWFFHIIYLLVIRSGGIPLHAAMLTKGNLAVLISAPGKTGKTTCCLKARLPWRAQCDEQVIITKGKTAFWAHTLPTLAAPVKNSFQAGKTGRAFRLSAIFFLEQSAIDAFIQLSPAEAAGLIYKHIQFKAAKNFITATFNPPQEFEHNKIETACQISKTIPAFILRATLNGNFQKSIEQALRSGKTPRRTPSQMQLYQPKLKVAPPT
jgi:SynChlorMet cassette protein ScmC